VPTLLVSGHPDQISSQPVGGAVKFLAQPFGMAEFFAAVRDLLDPTRNRGGNAPSYSPVGNQDDIPIVLCHTRW
jgi:hypothetical protein